MFMAVAKNKSVADQIKGDLIVLTPNGTRIVARWDNCIEKIMDRCLWTEQMNIRDTSGKLLHVQPWVLGHQGYPFAMGQRAAYQEVLVRFAESLGIKIHMNSRVEEHFETETAAGIVVNGVIHYADIVVGADGINSRCRVLVTGSEDKAESSGYAVFRAWFNLDEVKDPVINELRRGDGDSYDLWVGEDVHAFCLTCPSLNMIVYALTHRDKFDAEESYSHPGKVADILETCKDWDPRYRAVVQATPPNRLVDWKLLWRDPVKNWVSKGGRIAIIGDAAHPFLPTSGNGAVQALEDAATIAAVLRLAGKANIATALRAFETLR
jgi:2-polyprenyl-6-methoxyphenol hydroxylase-like FAD-dependent oxidoreductase